MAQQYTIDEAKAELQKQGVEWTPEIEANLRKAGRIKERQYSGLPAAKEAALALASAISGPLRSGPAFDALAKTATGTTLGEQTAGGFVRGASAGTLGLDIPPPQSAIQGGANLFGQGGGMAATMAGLTPGVAGLAAKIANQVARSVATAMGVGGAYGAASPAQSLGERAVNTANTATVMGAASMVPGLPLVSKVAAIPFVGRPAVDLGTFTAMGTADKYAADPSLRLRDMPKTVAESAAESVPMMMGMSGVTGLKGYEAEVRPRRFWSETSKPDPIAEVLTDYVKGKITKEQLPEILDKQELLKSPSGEVAAAVAQDPIKDLGPSILKGRHRMIEAIGGGVHDSQIVRSTTRVFEAADRAKEKMTRELQTEWRNLLEASGIKKGDTDSPQLAEFMRLYKTGMDAQALAATPEGQAALSGAKNPERVITAAPGFRAQFDKEFQMRDAIIRATGEKTSNDQGGMPYREGYWPRPEKKATPFVNPVEAIKSPANAARNFVNWAEQVSRPTQGVDAGDATVLRRRVFSGHELPQTGKPKPVETDPYKFMDSVTADTARKVTNSAALNAGQNVAKELADAGYTKSANAIRTIANSGYNDMRYGWTGKLEQAMRGTRTGTVAHKSMLALKRGFNVARYTFNVPFMVLRQWTSTGLAAAYGDVEPSMIVEALRRSAFPESGQKYAESYTGFIKNRRSGHISAEGMRGDVANQRGVNRRNRVAQAVQNVVEWPTNSMENWTGRFSVELADLIAERSGMPPELRADFRSDVAGKTQSFYDAVNRAEILNSTPLNLAFPAQSFGLESLNVAREILGNNTGLNMYKTTGEKAAASARVASLMFMYQLVNTYVNSYKDKPKDILADNAVNTVASSVPYASSVIGVGPATGRAYPMELADDLKNAVRLAHNGDMEGALNEVAKNMLAAVARPIKAQTMVNSGELAPEDQLGASIMGYQTTPSGKAAIRYRMGYDSANDNQPAGSILEPTSAPVNRATRVERRKRGN